MKLKLNILFVIVYMAGNLATTSEVVAACDPACKAAKFRYLGCDKTTGLKVNICTANPRATTNFRPFKKCFPIEVAALPFAIQEWNAWYLDLNLDKKSQPNEVIFDANDATTIISHALDNWAAICNPPDNLDCDNCSQVRVIWSRRDEDMKSHPGALAVTFQPTPSAGAPTCIVDCLASYIAINSSDDFLKVTSASKAVPKQFFYTNRTGPHDNVDWYDFQSVIEHEMGHFLGFSDNQEQCNSSYTGLMETPLPPNTEVSLSNSDRCMFEKLYCCFATGVEEEPPTINSTFNIFPNPISSSVTIALSPTAAQYGKHLRILDMAGKIVLERQFQAGSSDCTVSIAGFSAGSYLFVMTFDGVNGSFSQKVVVQ